MGTVATPTTLYEVSSIKSKDITVKAESEFTAKAGHLVFMTDTDGKYIANAVATSLIPTASTDESPKGAVAVLLEDTDVSTSEVTAKAIIAGVVYYDMVRAAGIDATKCPDWLLDLYSAKQSAILFLGKED